MHLSELVIINFRQFGAEDPPFKLTFNPGVTALIGENDAGKTAIIDAIRYVLLTRDADYLKVLEEDFHIPSAGEPTREITLLCRLSGLSLAEKAAFVEYLTYEQAGTCLYIHWMARRLPGGGGNRRWVDVSVHSGKDGSGPSLEASVRQLLATAYLKPLRDAEREMSSGRSSRLSQILNAIKAVQAGEAFDVNAAPANLDDLDRLSLLGLSDFMRKHMEQQEGLREAEAAINTRYLERLTFQGDELLGRIRFMEDGTPEIRLRRLLERLELGLLGGDGVARGTYGLGSNNMLFMACELLLLGTEPDGLPLLLVEEPEAHLHPQRQLRLMQFLEAAASPVQGEGPRPVQVILTTHSPNLASQIQVENLVLLKGSRAYPLNQGQTRLDKSDYRFLQRFLDATKANLFFARGVIIVEGDAEAILLPTLARLLGRDLTARGVSIVNVGGTGLRRFARIFQRNDKFQQAMGVPVACVTDLDVMPDCAPEILALKDTKQRKWRKRSDLAKDWFEQENALDKRREMLSEGDGQGVSTFVAGQWTLEYDLAYSGLEAEVFEAAWLAKNNDALNKGRIQEKTLRARAKPLWEKLHRDFPDDSVLRCVHIYKLFHTKKASKAIAAQYMAELLEERFEKDCEGLARKLPLYLLEAIGHVTEPIPVPAKADVTESCEPTCAN